MYCSPTRHSLFSFSFPSRYGPGPGSGPHLHLPRYFTTTQTNRLVGQLTGKNRLSAAAAAFLGCCGRSFESKSTERSLCTNTYTESESESEIRASTRAILQQLNNFQFNQYPFSHISHFGRSFDSVSSISFASIGIGFPLIINKHHKHKGMVTTNMISSGSRRPYSSSTSVTSSTSFSGYVKSGKRRAITTATSTSNSTGAGVGVEAFSRSKGRQGEGKSSSNFLFKLDLKGSHLEMENNSHNNSNHGKGKSVDPIASSNNTNTKKSSNLKSSKEVHHQNRLMTSNNAKNNPNNKGRKKEMLKVVYRRGFNEAYSIFQNLTLEEKQNLQPMVYNALVYYAILDIDNKIKFLRHKGVSEYWIGWESNDIKSLMFRLKDILQTMVDNDIFLPRDYILQIVKALQNLGNHHYMVWMHDFFIDTHLHLYEGIYRISPTPEKSINEVVGTTKEEENGGEEKETTGKQCRAIDESSSSLLSSSIRDGPLFDPETINLMIITYMNGGSSDRGYYLFEELQYLQDEKRQMSYATNNNQYNTDDDSQAITESNNQNWVVLGSSTYSVVITDLIGASNFKSALELIQEYTSIYGVNFFLYRSLLDHVIKDQAFEILHDVLIETVKNNVPIDRGTCLILLNLVSNHIARNDGNAEKKKHFRPREESSIESGTDKKEIAGDVGMKNGSNGSTTNTSNDSFPEDFQDIDLIGLIWEVTESSGYDISAEHYHAALEAFAYQNKDKSILLALNEMCSRGLAPSYASLCVIAKLMSQKGGLERIDMMYNDLLSMKETADEELANLKEVLEAQQQQVKEKSVSTKETEQEIDGEREISPAIERMENANLQSDINMVGCEYQLFPEPILLNLIAYAHIDLERTFSTFEDFSKFFGHEQSVATFNSLLTATCVQQNTATRIIDNTSFGHASFQRLKAAFPMMNPATAHSTVFSILEDMKKNNIQPDTETFDLCVKIMIQSQSILPQYPNIHANNYNNHYPSNQEFGIDDYAGNDKSDLIRFQEQEEAYREECKRSLYNQNQDISQRLHMIMDYMKENNITASPQTYRTLSYWFADRSNNAEEFNIVEECDTEMERLNQYIPSNYKMRISKLRQPHRERVKNKKKGTQISMPSLKLHQPSSIPSFHTTVNSNTTPPQTFHNYDFLIPESYNR